MQPSGLAARASELGLSHEEFLAWEPRLTPGVVAALLSSLVRYEDAVRELAAEDSRSAQATPGG
jgi:hypothetical protein